MILYVASHADDGTIDLNRPSVFLYISQTGSNLLVRQRSGGKHLETILGDGLVRSRWNVSILFGLFYFTGKLPSFLHHLVNFWNSDIEFLSCSFQCGCHVTIDFEEMDNDKNKL